MTALSSPACEPSDLVAEPTADAAAANPDVPQSRWSRRRATEMVAALDLAVAIAAGVMPALILDVGAAIDWRHVIQASIVGAILTLICISARNTYEPSRIHDFPVDAKALLADVAIGVCPVSGLGVPAALEGGTWLLWHLTWIGCGFAMVLAVHVASRGILGRLVRAGRFDRRVAVFGAGPIAKRLHDYMATNDHGMRFAGLYDDRGLDRVDPLGLPLLGKLNDLVAAARAGGLDQIIIALPQLADRRISDIAARFAGLPASVHIVTHLASDIIDESSAGNVSHIGPVGLLDIAPERITSSPAVIAA